MAVQDLQGTKQVYVAGPDNLVHILNVTLGPQAGDDWIIASGLSRRSTCNYEQSYKSCEMVHQLRTRRNLLSRRLHRNLQPNGAR